MSLPTDLSARVSAACRETPVLDLHTHLYPPAFGPLCLWGVDELLTYHYLIAEVLRVGGVAPEAFWDLSRASQAEFIWRELFAERPPISEACRGVATALSRLGIDASARDLSSIRRAFADLDPSEHLDRVLGLANVRQVVMTNDPLDPAERALWQRGVEVDPRFRAVVRIDPLLLGWPGVSAALADAGCDASADLGARSLHALRVFLDGWVRKMRALYVAVSLPPTWRYPDDSPTTRVIRDVVLPVTREHNLPFALMIGVTRRVNPALRLAGDSLAPADLPSLERLLAENPANKFMVTMLSLADQHGLAVTARKFRNLLVFGCWWFLNNPSLVESITRMRVELLGTSFVPQHSDCRILEQLIYKWDHSRAVIERVLVEKFADLRGAGWAVSDADIARAVGDYYGGNFERFCAATM